MRIWRITFCTTLFAALNLTLAADDRSALVKIGITRSQLRDQDQAKFNSMAKEFRTVLQQRTGLKGDIVAVDSAEDVRKQLEAGTLQLGGATGIEFGWMRSKQPDLEPLMITVSPPDALIGAVIVAKDSQVKSFADLRGQILSLPKGNRANIEVYISRLCRLAGSNSKEFFAETRRPSTIEDALEDLVEHRAQVVVTDMSGVRTYQRLKPGRYARLRILEQSDPFPPGVTVYMKGKLDPDARQRFLAGMTDVHKTESGARLMSFMGIKEFQPVPADYIKQVTDKLKDYPPP